MSFTTLLVANRGEIARRVMRGAREMGIRCVAVYNEDDVAAPHVRDADEAMRLPGGYLDAKAILEAARASGAGAIHPGYGFLAENAGFAADVIAAGLAWVGPEPDAIERMGDKLAAKKLAEGAGVPILPGSEDPRDAAEVGFPLLVKAAAGGGGKGMRVVEDAAGLEAGLASARREAQIGFGDDRVFLERYVGRARHIEIQILGDAHGNLVHLGERECSIQRRHQKILEESPSPRVDDALRETMGEAALRLGRALGYRSAGTVEFLVDDESGEFFFLEVNTRLQVEHPVTEAVTGIDLVREQLRIARGEPLGYEQQDISFSGAAIEARLYAENPAKRFLPATGTLFAFEPAAAPVVRWDSGVEAGSVIGTRFDPMLAKVIAAGPTRTEAAGRLALALSRLHLGGVVTNRDFLVATLRSPEFLAGDTTTDFIERVDPPRTLELPEDELLRLARSAALWIQCVNRSEAHALRATPTGWRNARMPSERVKLAAGEREIEVRYRAVRDGSFRFEAPPTEPGAGTASATELGHGRIHAWRPDGLDVEIDGRRAQVRISRWRDRLVVQGAQGGIELRLLPRFELPGSEAPSGGLTAPMPGKVIDVSVRLGDTVRAGQTLMILEAMKMEQPITAPEDGVVTELNVALGDQVEGGTLLLVVEGASSTEPDTKGES